MNRREESVEQDHNATKIASNDCTARRRDKSGSEGFCVTPLDNKVVKYKEKREDK